MKKTSILFVLVVLLLLIFPQIPVSANPVMLYGNDFLKENADDCVLSFRYYRVNGESGALSVKRRPGAEREVARFNSGEVLLIYATYDNNGEVWGAVDYEEYTSRDRDFCGWVPMDQLRASYDYVSFEEDFGDEFKKFDGGDMPLISSDVVLWTSPVDGEIISVVRAEWIYKKYVDDMPPPLNVFKDSEGRDWGFFDCTFYIYHYTWICLDDLTFVDTPPFDFGLEPELMQSEGINPGESGSNVTGVDNPNTKDDEHDVGTSLSSSSTDNTKAEDEGHREQAPSSAKPPPLILIITLVTILAAASATLILLFWKSRGRG